MSKILNLDIPNHSIDYLLAAPAAPQYEHYDLRWAAPIGMSYRTWFKALRIFYARLIYEVYLPQSLLPTPSFFKSIVAEMAGKMGIPYEQD